MKKQHITLTETERTYLKRLLKKGQVAARIYKRATALLELDREKTFAEVAETVGVTIQTVSKWAKKYNSTGLEFLKDKPRPGRPQLIDGLQRAKVTALACSEPPKGYTKWSLRLLADKAVELELIETISHSKVQEILKKTNSSPT